jgi:hypothetical protein
MLLPMNADGFRVTFGSLRSLGEKKGVNFHTYSLPMDRCVRLLLKKLGKRMPEAEIKEELKALRISVQAVVQLRSNRRDQDPEKNRPLTPHFIVSVARGPEVAKVRSLAELRGLRLQVETYIAPKVRFNANAASALGTRSETAATHPGAWLAETRTSQGRVRSQSSCLNDASARATTLRTIVVAVSGTTQWLPQQSRSKESAARSMVSPHASRHPNQLQLDLLPNGRIWAQVGNTCFVAAASLRLKPRKNPPSIHLARVGRPVGWLPQQWTSLNPVVPGRRW